MSKPAYSGIRSNLLAHQIDRFIHDNPFQQGPKAASAPVLSKLLRADERILQNIFCLIRIVTIDNRRYTWPTVRAYTTDGKPADHLVGSADQFSTLC